MSLRMCAFLLSATLSAAAQAHEGLHRDGWLHDGLHRLGASDWFLSLLLLLLLGAGVMVAASVRRARRAPLAAPTAPADTR